MTHKKGEVMKTELLQINNNRGIFVNKNTDKIVIMIGGFERSATTEKKFKKLTDNLNFSSYRFDYSGVGLSDGNFSNITIASMQKELKNVLNSFKKIGYKNFIVVAHSLSACVVLNMNFDKKILIAPAINQKGLLRYWFSLFISKKEGIGEDINWNNYQDYFKEKDFLKDCEREDKMTKQNYISSAYFLENKDKDYSESIISDNNILYIHGDKDVKFILCSEAYREIPFVPHKKKVL